MNIRTVKQIDSYDWDALVIETYNKPYCYQQQDGCKSRGVETINVPSRYPQDSDQNSIPFEVNGHKMGVSFKTWLETTPEDTQKHFGSDWENDLFWSRNFYPDISMIIDDLHSKGLLEKGEYQIVIDW